MQSAEEACTFVPSGMVTIVEDVGGGQVRSAAVRSPGTWGRGSGGLLSAAETAAIEPRKVTMNAMSLMMPAYLHRVDIW